MTNQDIADVLAQVAVLMELKGENPFRSRAFQNVARQVEALERPVAELLRTGELSGVRGIGKGMSDAIGELARTGRLGLYETLKASLPAGLIEMLGVPGLGPRRVRLLHEGLRVETPEALEAACREGRVRGLPGFGEKTQAQILSGLETLLRSRGLRLLQEAREEAERIRGILGRHPAAIAVEVAGSVRRCADTVKDLSLVARARDAGGLLEAFLALAGAAAPRERTETSASLVPESGLPVRLRIAPEAEFGSAFHRATGNPGHFERMAARARSLGLRLDESGLRRGEERVPCPDEATLFERMGLDFIPPEQREGGDEVEAAARGALPRLVTAGDLKGVLHAHTRDSDGVHTLEEMARGARARGYTYLGICDHSRSLPIANGLSAERLRRQGEEIDRLNEELEGIRILKGVESDILADGSLDYEDEVLAGLDIVVASVHSGMRMSEEKATERLIRAIRNPFTTILGHPTGRLRFSREGYPVRVEKVLDAAAERGVAVEFNASPQRMDLDWRFLRAATERGVRVAIAPDAHRVEEIDQMAAGVGTARKGWLTREDVLNAMPVEDFLGYLRERRKGR